MHVKIHNLALIYVCVISHAHFFGRKHIWHFWYFLAEPVFIPPKLFLIVEFIVGNNLAKNLM